MVHRHGKAVIQNDKGEYKNVSTTRFAAIDAEILQEKDGSKRKRLEQDKKDLIKHASKPLICHMIFHILEKPESGFLTQ